MKITCNIKNYFRQSDQSAGEDDISSALIKSWLQFLLTERLQWDDVKTLWWDRSPYNQGITNKKAGYLRPFLLFFTAVCKFQFNIKLNKFESRVNGIHRKRFLTLRGTRFSAIISNTSCGWLCKNRRKQVSSLDELLANTTP